LVAILLSSASIFNNIGIRGFGIWFIARKNSSLTLIYKVLCSGKLIKTNHLKVSLKKLAQADEASMRKIFSKKYSVFKKGTLKKEKELRVFIKRKQNHDSVKSSLPFLNMIQKSSEE